MARQLYERISKTNSTDSETDVLELVSTNEEEKIIKAIGILKDTNAGILRAYHERDNFVTYPTGNISESNALEIPIELELPIGESFAVTLQNENAGTNAALTGYIRYELKG